MRCYHCEQITPALFPVLTETGRNQHACKITIYVCAACFKNLQKAILKEEKK